MTRLLVELIFGSSIVVPILFLMLSVVGKLVTRSESFTHPLGAREALYRVLTNGSVLALVAVAMVIAAIMVRASIGDYLEASRLFRVALLLVAVYLVVCVMESVFNDPSRARFFELKAAWLGLYVPTVIGGVMVAIATSVIGVG